MNTKFLCETSHIDLSAINIQAKAAELFDGITDNAQKARIAYEFVSPGLVTMPPDIIEG